MNKPNQLVLIGGGTSVKEGISKGLWNKLNNRFTIGCNYSFNWFISTFQTYVDGNEQKDFYYKERNNMKDLPLIIGNKLKIPLLPNTIGISGATTYHRDLLHGVYKVSLSGIYALSLAIWLLDIGEIFILGMDYGELRKKDFEKFATSPQELGELTVKDEKGRAMTHWYQGKLEHRGIGQVSHFNSKGRVDKDYSIYEKEEKIKIYNVSLVSKIKQFEKISYDEFFKKLDNNKYDQTELRQWIRKKCIMELDEHILTY